MSLNSGVYIACDYPGCPATSDDYLEARGTRWNNMSNLYLCIEREGWRTVFPLDIDSGKVKHYCKKHANDKNMADQRHAFRTRKDVVDV